MPPLIEKNRLFKNIEFSEDPEEMKLKQKYLGSKDNRGISIGADEQYNVKLGNINKPQSRGLKASFGTNPATSC